MGKFHIGIKGIQEFSETPLVSMEAIVEEAKVIHYVPIQQPEQQIVYIDKTIEVPVEKIVYVDRIIESEPRVIVEYKTVEVPVMYEKIVEVPIEIIKEVIVEKPNKVIDISNHLEVKKELRKNKQYKKALALSLIVNVILLCLAVR